MGGGDSDDGETNTDTPLPDVIGNGGGPGVKGLGKGMEDRIRLLETESRRTMKLMSERVGLIEGEE